MFSIVSINTYIFFIGLLLLGLILELSSKLSILRLKLLLKLSPKLLSESLIKLSSETLLESLSELDNS